MSGKEKRTSNRAMKDPDTEKQGWEQFKCRKCWLDPVDICPVAAYVSLAPRKGLHPYQLHLVNRSRSAPVYELNPER